MENLVATSDVRHSQARALPHEGHAIHQILVCLDNSPFADACLRQAVAISRGFGSAITLLYVMQPPRERSGLRAPDVLDWEISRQEASAYLERMGEEETRASGSPVLTRLEQGQPAARIAAVAREIGADLTVLGSHGERGVAASNLGGTMLEVLTLTRGSVLIARSGNTGDGSPKRILLPLDGASRTESVLPTAVRIASAHGAELLLVFVVREPVATAVLRTPEDLKAAADLAARLEANGKRYLDDLRGQLAREGTTSVRTLVVRSVDEKQAVLEVSLREASDLIVVSAHGSTCNPALAFGGVTAHLLTHSGVPLLVLQDLPDAGGRIDGNSLRAPPLRATYAEDV